MDEVAAALRAHDGFAYDPEVGTARVTTTPFDAVVGGETDDDGVTFTARVVVPTLSAAVEEPVGEAVERGWRDTLERRLADAYDVARTTGAVSVEDTTADGEPAVEVALRFVAPADQGVEDAAALVNFVEGTYLQGTVPGYTYREPVAGLLSTARQRGQGEQPGG